MKIIEKILDALGIKVIPYAFGILKFNITTPIESQKLILIKEKIKNFTNKNADNALPYCKELFEDEMKRGEKIESKAYSLIGVTSISAAFITGISKLLPEQTIQVFPWQNTSLITIYILIVISLTLTTLLASRVVIVGGYKFAYPDITDIFNVNSKSLLATKKERVNDYLYCYINNYKIHNTKASFLIGSQIWFRNTIVLFLLLAFILAPSIFKNLNTGSPAPTTTITIPSTSVPQSTSTIQVISTNTVFKSPTLQVSATMTLMTTNDDPETPSPIPSLIQTP